MEGRHETMGGWERKVRGKRNEDCQRWKEERCDGRLMLHCVVMHFIYRFALDVQTNCVQYLVTFVS